MARTKQVSDKAVLAIVTKTLLVSGEKAVTFSTIARKCGLSAPTLVQRFGSCAAMIETALTAAWDQLEVDTTMVFAQTEDKGVQGTLKALSQQGDTPALLIASLKAPALATRAKAWRDQVETALALKLGSGAKADETAAVAFAAWQGRMLWDAAGGKGFRFGEAVKRLNT